jgi:hypothetical protein
MASRLAKASTFCRSSIGRCDAYVPQNSSAGVTIEKEKDTASALKRGREPAGRSRSTRMDKFVSSM